MNIKWITYNTPDGWELFRDASLSIREGVIFGLVWPNGSGKSTLLKIISGEITPQSGQVNFKRDLLWFMRQSARHDLWDKDVISYITEEVGIADLERIMDSTDWNDEKSKDAYSEAETSYSILDGYHFASKIDEILWWLWAEFKLDSKLHELSWGQVSRVLLAVALLRGRKLLLLDEPTNSLDKAGRDWLSKYLQGWSAPDSALIVSHDRDFLDETTDATFYIDPKKWKIFSFWWNYSEFRTYMQKKSQTERDEYERKLAEVHDKRKDLKDAENAARWRGRSYKLSSSNTDGLSKWFLKNKGEKKSGQVLKQTQRSLESLEKDLWERPDFEDIPKFSFSEWGELVGGIEVSDIFFRYKDSGQEFIVPSFEAKPGNRILIEWPNWSWKTTIINLLTWQLDPLSQGKYVLHPSMKVWIFDQKDILTWSELTPLEYLKKDFSEFPLEDLYSSLAHFWVSGALFHQKMNTLSEWQRCRVRLAHLKLQKANCLILDEVTNHLDIFALEWLEVALKDYPGIIICVTHDERFKRNIWINKTYSVIWSTLTQQS